MQIESTASWLHLLRWFEIEEIVLSFRKINEMCKTAGTPIAVFLTAALQYLLLISSSHGSGPPSADLQHCSTPGCFRDKSALVRMGYDPSIAERISVYRPDLARLILSPDIPIRPGEFMEAIPHNHGSYDPHWFESQVQDRRPITVYRGMAISENPYDPTYFYKGNMPVIDGRVFTSDKLGTALGYALHDPNGGMVLRMQIPRFMLYEKKAGPYGLVYFRDMVPNDWLLVTGVAYPPPESTLFQVTPSTTRNDLLEEASKIIKFESFESNYARLARVPLNSEKRLGSNGRFVFTRSWADSICRITEHPEFKRAILDSGLLQHLEAKRLLRAIHPPESNRKLVGKTVNQLQARLEHTKRFLSELPKRRASRCLGGALARVSLNEGTPPAPAITTEFDNILFQRVIDSIYHCLHARTMWLNRLSK